jgi:uncharacterized protein YcbX
MPARLTVTQLNVYPVKSCRGIPLGTVQLDRWGIRHDRNWMVVDVENRFISQRTQPRLALVEPAVAQDLLTLNAPAMPPLELPATGRAGPERTVTVWDDSCKALDQGDSAAEWFSRYLGQPARLVRIGAGFLRPVNEVVYPDGADVAFVDAYPLLVLSEASLDALNARLAEPLPMNRFRPNLVVAGCESFAEDGWKRIRIGEVVLQIVSACERCATTTVDQSTGTPGKEPLATLATFRRRPEGSAVIFGMNAVHQAVGSLRLGDAVEVLA